MHPASMVNIVNIFKDLDILPVVLFLMYFIIVNLTILGIVTKNVTPLIKIMYIAISTIL